MQLDVYNPKTNSLTKFQFNISKDNRLKSEKLTKVGLLNWQLNVTLAPGTIPFGSCLFYYDLLVKTNLFPKLVIFIFLPYYARQTALGTLYRFCIQ